MRTSTRAVNALTSVKALFRERDELVEVGRKLVTSTEVNGQRFSVMPSCKAWADFVEALEQAEKE